MIVPQFFIYVLVYVYSKLRKYASITFKEIENYGSVSLAVALSVDVDFLEKQYGSLFIFVAGMYS